MDMAEYQTRARATAVYPGHKGDDERAAISYLALKLNGEAGEVAELIGKHLRGDDGSVDLTPERRERIAKELGDVLWYVAMLAFEIGYPLQALAVDNLHKLTSRQQAGTLKGSGSDR